MATSNYNEFFRSRANPGAASVGKRLTQPELRFYDAARRPGSGADEIGQRGQEQ